VWTDSAQQSTITNVFSGSQTGTTTSTFKYDKNNHVTQVTATGNAARTLSYITDSVGQVMARKQITNGSTTSPEQFYFYFNGVQIGQIGNNGDDNTNYAAAIKQETTTPGTGPFTGGSTVGTPSANFGEGYGAMNPIATGEAGAGAICTVGSGDTLASIAQANGICVSEREYCAPESSGRTKNCIGTAADVR